MSWLRRIYFNFLYFGDPPWDTQISPPELMDFIENTPPGRALDLGCGTGTNVITLAKHGWQVTGVDYVGRAIRKAEKKAEKANVAVKFVIDDVSKLENISGKFDFILDIGCYHSLDASDQDSYVQNLEKYTTEGSVFMLYGFFRNQDGSGQGMLPADLNRFRNCFKLVKREDSTDRDQRPSVWVTFKRKADN